MKDESRFQENTLIIRPADVRSTLTPLSLLRELLYSDLTGMSSSEVLLVQQLGLDPQLPGPVQTPQRSPTRVDISSASFHVSAAVEIPHNSSCFSYFG